MYLLFIGYVMILYYLFIIFLLVYTCLSVLNKGFYVPIVNRIYNDIVLPIHKFPVGLYMFIRVEQGILCTYCS